MLVVQRVDTCQKFAFISIVRHQRAPKIKFHELKLEAINAPSCHVLLGYVLQFVLLLLWDLVGSGCFLNWKYFYSGTV
jgi:hypothetical protein